MKKSNKEIVKEFNDRLKDCDIPVSLPKKPEHWEFTGAYEFFITGQAGIYLSQLDKTFIGTENYMGFAYFWGHEYKHILRDCNNKQRQRIHGAWVEAGLDLTGHSEAHYAVIVKHARKHC